VAATETGHTDNIVQMKTVNEVVGEEEALRVVEELLVQMPDTVALEPAEVLVLYPQGGQVVLLELLLTHRPTMVV
jgi:hypothetical protein